MSINRRDYPPMPGGMHWPNDHGDKTVTDVITEQVDKIHTVGTLFRPTTSNDAHAMLSKLEELKPKTHCSVCAMWTALVALNLVKMETPA